MSLWVCSKWNGNPTDEEKWEVFDSDGPFYQTVKRVEEYVGWMPKSDYRPCDPPKPPERWTDVTAECEVGFFDDDAFAGNHKCLNGNGYIIDASHGRINVLAGKQNGYRLRKVQLYLSRPDSDKNCTRWAFIVEKREG